MNFILKRMKIKKTDPHISFVLYHLNFQKKNRNCIWKNTWVNLKKNSWKNGFGYDPIFIPYKEKKTFGQFSKMKKIKMDHRFIAFKKLKKGLKLCKFIIFNSVNF